MATFNSEIHHRRSVRLVGFDYSRPGYYFVTICLNDIRCMLAVMGGARSLRLTPIGEIAKQYWMEIPRHYPNVKLDEFVIMPDHVHGILKFRDVGNGYSRRGVQFSGEKNPNCGMGIKCRGVQLNAPKEWNNSNTATPAATNPQSEYFSKLSPIGCSLPVIIRNYKSTVKRWCNENGFPQFKWQRSFHDRIIRDEKSLWNIRQYIRNNPPKWLARSGNHLADELKILRLDGEMWE